MKAPTSFALLLSLTACGGNPFPQFNVDPGTTPIYGTKDGGSNDTPTDGGTSPDGGVPTCDGDLDGQGQGDNIVISEIGFGTKAFLEFYNRASTSRSTQPLQLSGSVTGVRIVDANLAAHEHTLTDVTLSPTQGEIAVYVNGTMTQYVCWGATQSVTDLQNAAVFAGLWYPSGVCVQADSSTKALHLRGAGTNPLDYQPAPATPLGCTRD